MLLAWGCQEGVNLVSQPDPGGGWEDFGTPKEVRKIWFKTELGGEWPNQSQSLGHYLGKTMTLRDLIWDNPAEHIDRYLLFPPLQSSATGPARPVGGGEERGRPG